MQLSELLKNRNNGLTQARLILAFFVLHDHAYAINGIDRPNVPGLPISLSEASVWLFIFLSGLLCYRSAERHNTNRYLVARLGRLMPGYWMCLILTGLIAMPAFKTIGLGGGESWRSMPIEIMHFWEKNLLLTQGQFAPEGWLQSLPVHAFNGSLWTLQPELMGYFVILLLAPILSKSKVVTLISFSILNLAVAFQPNITRRLLENLLGGYGFELSNNSYLKLALFLLAGMVFYRFSDSIPIRKTWGAIALFLLGTSSLIHYKLFILALPILLPYILIVISSATKWPWRAEGTDYSYGFYLYSFPIQQLILGFSKYLGYVNPIGFQIAMATAFVMPFAWMSWHLVEKPSLKWIASLSLSRER